MVSTRTLLKVALGGVIFVGGTGIILQSRIRKNFCNQAYFIKPLKILEEYRPGGDILGRPVEIRKVDLGDHENNWTNGTEAKVAIPLRGSNTSGILHAWSDREDVKHEWTVNKADLEINGKQWTFYINPAVKDRFKPTQDTSATSELPLT